MQYTYEMSTGRIGIGLTVWALNAEANPEQTVHASINQKGFAIVSGLGPICDFDSFRYPDDIEEDEVNFIKAINGPFSDVVEKTIWLCSMLCSQWSAGHNDEALHRTVRETLETW